MSSRRQRRPRHRYAWAKPQAYCVRGQKQQQQQKNKNNMAVCRIAVVVIFAVFKKIMQESNCNKENFSALQQVALRIPYTKQIHYINKIWLKLAYGTNCIIDYNLRQTLQADHFRNIRSIRQHYHTAQTLILLQYVQFIFHKTKQEQQHYTYSHKQQQQYPVISILFRKHNTGSSANNREKRTSENCRANVAVTE